MTDKNKKSNIGEELSRAETALGAADLLAANSYRNEAVSRLYYYLLYEIRALLLTECLEPKSHEDALRLFSLHFVKNGSFPSDSSHTFSKLMKYREEADYNPSYSFTKMEFQKLRDETQGCVRIHGIEVGLGRAENVLSFLRDQPVNQDLGSLHILGSCQNRNRRRRSIPPARVDLRDVPVTEVCGSR
jgi:uncharacterized protein (UPF0332 family)